MPRGWARWHRPAQRPAPPRSAQHGRAAAASGAGGRQPRPGKLSAPPPIPTLSHPVAAAARSMSGPGAQSRNRRLPADMEQAQRSLDAEQIQQQQLKLRDRQKFFEEVFQHEVDFFFPMSHLQIEHRRPPLGSISSMEVNVDMLEQMDMMDLSDQDTVDVFLGCGTEESSVAGPLPGTCSPQPVAGQAGSPSCPRCSSALVTLPADPPAPIQRQTLGSVRLEDLTLGWSVSVSTSTSPEVLTPGKYLMLQKTGEPRHFPESMG
uniref:Dysbindin domain containing 2 n=1 Tax=Calidris pygmaea TaxID=425635 RepID=A0A8C3KCN2_9CHAR